MFQFVRNAFQRKSSKSGNGFGAPLEEGMSEDKLYEFRDILARKDFPKIDAIIAERPNEVNYVERLLSDDMTNKDAARWLAGHYMQKSDWKKMSELTKHGNSLVRGSTTLFLADSAENGMDILSALPTVGEALFDTNETVRKNAVRALLVAAQSVNSKDAAVSLFASALSNGDEGVKIMTSDALLTASKNGINISLASEQLGQALGGSPEVSNNAVSALLNASTNPESSGPVLEVLGRLLSNESRLEKVSILASKILMEASERNSDISPVISILQNALHNGNEEIRVNVSSAIAHAGANGLHVSSAIPALGDALGDKNETVRSNAEKALGYAVVNPKTSVAAASVLSDKLSAKNKYARQHASRALWTAVVTEKTREMGLSVLATALSHTDVEVRINAAKALSTAGKKGIELGSALTGLGKALADREEVRDEALNTIVLAAQNANTRELTVSMLANQVKSGERVSRLVSAKALAMAAQKGVDCTEAIPTLTTALTDSNRKVREQAAWALGSAARKGNDITHSIHDLSVALRATSSRTLRQNASWAILCAVEKHADISQAITMLANAFSDRDPKVRLNAAMAMVKAAAHERTREAALASLGELLSRSDDKAREYAAWSCLLAVENGVNISALVAQLGKTISDEDNAVKVNSALALLLCVERGINISAAIAPLGQAILDSNDVVASSSTRAVMEAGLKGMTVSTIENFVKIGMTAPNPEVRGLCGDIMLIIERSASTTLDGDNKAS